MKNRIVPRSRDWEKHFLIKIQNNVNENSDSVKYPHKNEVRMKRRYEEAKKKKFVIHRKLFSIILHSVRKFLLLSIHR